MTLKIFVNKRVAAEGVFLGDFNKRHSAFAWRERANSHTDVLRGLIETHLVSYVASY